MCTGICAPGYADCDGDAADGCEVDLNTDDSNCGACGVACIPGRCAYHCAAGRCPIPGCQQGFADCDCMLLNGCEVNTLTDPKNCGACGNVCGPGLVCSNSVCSCPPGLTLCNGACVDTSRDILHCGRCGIVCLAPANATPGCSGGMCGIGACNRGFDDCDKVAANGCEASLNGVRTCGACNIACSGPNHLGFVCFNGTCNQEGCEKGFADCDVNKTDCEVDINTDPKNCGGCGMACLAPRVCTNGKCM